MLAQVAGAMAVGETVSVYIVRVCMCMFVCMSHVG